MRVAHTHEAVFATHCFGQVLTWRPTVVAVQPAWRMWLANFCSGLCSALDSKCKAAPIVLSGATSKGPQYGRAQLWCQHGDILDQSLPWPGDHIMTHSCPVHCTNPAFPLLAHTQLEHSCRPNPDMLAAQTYCTTCYTSQAKITTLTLLPLFATVPNYSTLEPNISIRCTPGNLYCSCQPFSGRLLQGTRKL